MTGRKEKIIEQSAWRGGDEQKLKPTGRRDVPGHTENAWNTSEESNASYSVLGASHAKEK